MTTAQKLALMIGSHTGMDQEESYNLALAICAEFNVREKKKENKVPRKFHVENNIFYGDERINVSLRMPRALMDYVSAAAKNKEISANEFIVRLLIEKCSPTS